MSTLAEIYNVSLDLNSNKIKSKFSSSIPICTYLTTNPNLVAVHLSVTMSQLYIQLINTLDE